MQRQRIGVHRPAGQRVAVGAQREDGAVGGGNDQLLLSDVALSAARRLAAQADEERRRLAAAADREREAATQVGIVVQVERAPRLAAPPGVVGRRGGAG